MTMAQPTLRFPQTQPAIPMRGKSGYPFNLAREGLPVPTAGNALADAAIIRRP